MNIAVLNDFGLRGKTHDRSAFPRSRRFGFSPQEVRSPGPRTPGANCDRDSSTDSHDPNRIGVAVPTKVRSAELRRPCGGTLARAALGVAVSSAPATELPSQAALIKGDRELLQALVNSRIFAEYKRAFSGATGLPVALQPVESFRLPDHGKGNENPFCALLAQKNRSCGECLNVQVQAAHRLDFHWLPFPGAHRELQGPVAQT